MSESPVHAGNAPPGFEEQARDVVRRLRSAMTNLVSVAGADPTNARSMARKFGINKNLAWRVSNIIRSTDAIATVPYIPGPGGGNILLRAFTEAGAPIEQVALLRRSLNEFQSLVATHSADRETLEMMLGNLTHEGQRERDEAHRKLAYRGNSAIWGVRASAQYNCHLVAPSDRNDRLDHGRICGLMGFQRLRSNVRWTVSQIVRIAADGSQQTARVMFLSGHGVMVVGPTIAEAFDTLYYLDKAAELQWMALCTGRELNVVPDEVARLTRGHWEDYPADASQLHFDELLRILDREDPDYKD